MQPLSLCLINAMLDFDEQRAEDVGGIGEWSGLGR